jgi:hypothetical protein
LQLFARLNSKTSRRARLGLADNFSAGAVDAGTPVKTPAAWGGKAGQR